MNIGPILGILSLPRNLPNPFSAGQNESFIEIMSVAEKMNCFAYVFSPLDIDWSKKATWGYRYNSKLQPGEWERLLFPLPSIIYNRIPNRTLEKREDINNILTDLRKRYGSRFFNPFFLDKWTLHRILSNHEKTKIFLPETIKLETTENLKSMLRRHKSVYLKPIASSLGHEIMKVINKETHLHFYYQSLNEPFREGKVQNCNELLNLIQAPEKPAYLIQQAIHLAEYNDKAFDIRYLVQKNSQGKWQKTGLAARIAGENSITTHVFYGGTRIPAETALQYATAKHNFSMNKITKQLKLIQTLIPQTIEHAFKTAFGELEIDIGIDQKGKLWFLEANSKPFKFDEKMIRAKSLIRLMDYVSYLDKKNSALPSVR